MDTSKLNTLAPVKLTGADFTDMRRFATTREQRQYYADLFDRVMAADDSQLAQLDEVLPPLRDVFPDNGKKNSTPLGVNAKHCAKLTKGQPANAGLKIPLGLVQAIAAVVRREATSESGHKAARNFLTYVEQEATRVSWEVLVQLYGPGNGNKQ